MRNKERVEQMSYLGICGYFGEGADFEGGQPIKVDAIIKLLHKIMSNSVIETVNTYRWKKRAFALLMDCVKLAHKSNNIVLLPASNGVKILIPIFYFLGRIYKTKIHYIVIGGWLGKLVKKNLWLRVFLKRIHKIYVETSTLVEQLDELGIDNTTYLPNFKQLDFGIIHPPYYYLSDIKFCIFTRIVEQKGIEDAISAINEVNSNYHTVRCRLDIYGPLYDSYKNRFLKLINNTSSTIKYKGLVQSKYSVRTLQNYYMQIFPTKFFTEGIPGSIIDSYFAGLPVLASKWESFREVIAEGETGLGYEFNDQKDLSNKIEWAIENPSIIYQMRKKCQTKAVQFSANFAGDILLENLKEVYD